ncbi:hypothetical protein SteCoe_23979 [Stentor coeruleus]|uniref:Mei2-like C-terminal RNA recognition motif domain-containing protein n=1 Tax=Stentor coeruleus TaxID=5963 RepID=A0A1R2BJ47_9CILI|nr:hypothetical protein SteCoe_23979 [Stentor coeruleus]
MDTSHKKRLRVFKNITRDLTPEIIEKIAEINNHTKALSACSASHFSVFPNYENLKSRLSGANLHTPKGTQTSISTPKPCTYQQSRCTISAYKPSDSYTPSYIKNPTTTGFKPENPSKSISFDSSSEFFPGFSNNSPLLSISTQESSREEFEERRKPKKRPLAPNEKDLYIIKIQAIKLNQDTRTTIMIKNIPNKYTQKMLLQAIDKKFYGTYDFLYLPIDFKNRCNVGYAFINFVDSKVIPSFCQDFDMKKWERFNSEKICELAYGRIQGFNDLVQHFQNSSVINQGDSKVKPVIFGKN